MHVIGEAISCLTCLGSLNSVNSYFGLPRENVVFTPGRTVSKRPGYITAVLGKCTATDIAFLEGPWS